MKFAMSTPTHGPILYLPVSRLILVYLQVLVYIIYLQIGGPILVDMMSSGLVDTGANGVP
jgi:hypothetical protein